MSLIPALIRTYFEKTCLAQNVSKCSEPKIFRSSEALQVINWSSSAPYTPDENRTETTLHRFQICAPVDSFSTARNIFHRRILLLASSLNNRSKYYKTLHFPQFYFWWMKFLKMLRKWNKDTTVTRYIRCLLSAIT